MEEIHSLKLSDASLKFGDCGNFSIYIQIHEASVTCAWNYKTTPLCDPLNYRSFWSETSHISRQIWIRKRLLYEMVLRNQILEPFPIINVLPEKIIASSFGQSWIIMALSAGCKNAVRRNKLRDYCYRPPTLPPLLRISLLLLLCLSSNTCEQRSSSERVRRLSKQTVFEKRAPGGKPASWPETRWMQTGNKPAALLRSRIFHLSGFNSH